MLVLLDMFPTPGADSVAVLRGSDIQPANRQSRRGVPILGVFGEQTAMSRDMTRAPGQGVLEAKSDCDEEVTNRYHVINSAGSVKWPDSLSL